MAKWFGNIGFAETVETAPGVWEEVITPKPYYGDLIQNTRRLEAPDKVNDDVTISNEISIVSDPYVSQNFHAIRYAEFMNSKWKVTSISVEFPRLRLTLGGVYNENSN